MLPTRKRPWRFKRLAREASVSTAISAPTPGAAINIPRPSGPTPKTSFWKTGIKV